MENITVTSGICLPARVKPVIYQKPGENAKNRPGAAAECLTLYNKTGIKTIWLKIENRWFYSFRVAGFPENGIQGGAVSGRKGRKRLPEIVAPGPADLRLDITEIPEDKTARHWVITREAFADCSQPVPLKGPVEVEGRLSRSENTVYFSAMAHGAFELVCSRCAKSFEAPLAAAVEAVFLPREETKDENPASEEDAGEVETVYYEGETVDLFGPLRDQIALAEPMRPLCSEDCKGLCPRCGADWNEGKCDCRETGGDPRFAEIKKLLNMKEGENAGS